MIMMSELENKYERFRREFNIDLPAEIAAGGSEGGLTNYYDKDETNELLGSKADIADLESIELRVEDLESEPSGGVTDHGALTGLADDDHTQYLNNTRGDARYYTKDQVDNSLTSKADLVDLDELDDRVVVLEGSTGPDLTAYYDKTETNALLNDKADIVDLEDLDTRVADLEGSTGPDLTDYYDKIETDGLLADKASANDLTAHTSNTSNPHSVTKTQIGLGNVDNTSDLSKPISTSTQAALDGKAASNHNHDSSYYTKAQVDTSLNGKSDTSHNHDSRYYTETETDAFFTSAATALGNHVSNTSNPHSVTKAQVGLANVDNTSDANKPISSATQTALDGKASSSHAHSGADITSGTVPIGRIPTGTSGTTVSLGNHTHDDRYYTEAEADGLLNNKANTSHTHATADVTSGTFAIARIPTGTTGTTVALGNHNHTGVYANATHTHPATDVTGFTARSITGSGGVRPLRPIKPYAQDTAHSAFPSIAQRTDGVIVMVYRQGTDHVTTRDGVIKQATSSDNGRTWSAPATIVSAAAGTDLRDPCISLSRDGTKLYLTYFKGTSVLAAAGVFFRSSTDGGSNWSSEVRVDALSYSASTAPVFEMSDNTLVIPYYGKSGADTSDSVWIAKSTNGGTTWPTNTRILNGQTAGTDFQEPWMIQNGSTYIITYRHGTAGSIGVTTSADTTTWSAASAKFTGTGRPNVFAVNSDTIACIYRKLTGGDAVMRISKNNGTDWFPERLLEMAPTAAGWMTYAATAQITPNAVLCALGNESSSTNSRIYFTYIGEGGTITPYGVIPPDGIALPAGYDTMYYTTNFEQADGALTYPWTIASGALSVVNGRVQSTSADNTADFARVFVNSADVEVEAEITNEGDASAQSGAGIVFRMLNSGSYMLFTVETAGANFRLYKFISTTPTQLAVATPGTFQFNAYNRYKVIARGGTILCFFNGEKVLSFTHSSGETGGNSQTTFATGYYHGIKLNSQATGTSVHKCRKFTIQA